LAAATSSAIDLCGKPAVITTSSGASPSRAIGAKSATGSNGTLRMIWRAMMWVEAENSSV
jgi:hypothetical protein